MRFFEFFFVQMFFFSIGLGIVNCNGNLTIQPVFSYSLKEIAEFSKKVFENYVTKKKSRDDSCLSFADNLVVPFRHLDPSCFNVTLNFFFVMYFSSLGDFGINDQYITNEDRDKRDFYLSAIKGLLIVMKLFYGKDSSSLFNLKYLYEIVRFANYNLLVFCMEEFFYKDYKPCVINEIYELNKQNDITLLDLSMLMYCSTDDMIIKQQYLLIKQYLLRNNGISVLFSNNKF